jgi:cytoskeletal protein RodZ
MTWSGFFRSLSIFLIAVGLIAIGSFFAFQYLFTQFTALPPKPAFPNDKPNPAAAPTAKAIAKPPNSASPAISPAPSSTPNSDTPNSASASPTPSPSVSPSPGATYQARIKLDNGLNVRESPNADAARIGGVDFNQVVTVLEESPDKEWQRVRVEATGIEGWIKSGYADRAQ